MIGSGAHDHCRMPQKMAAQEDFARVRSARVALTRFAPSLALRLLCVVVTDMDRRSMMLMTGIGLLAAAIPVPRRPVAADVPADGSPPTAPPPRGIHLRGRVRRTGGLGARPVEVGDRDGARVDGGPDVLGAARERRAVPRRPPKRLRRRQVQPRLPRRKGRQHLLQRQGLRQVAGRHRPHLGSPDQAATASPRALGPPGTWPTTTRSTAAKSTSWSGTATASGPREPRSTPS